MTHKGGDCMFRRSDKELLDLQRQLLAVEEEEPEEEYEEEYEDIDEDYEDCFESDYEEEYDQEPFYRNHANNYGQSVKNYANRYGRGSPKKFDDDDFFDEGFDNEDVLYRKDYKKAQRKKRRKSFGLLILAIAEIVAIGYILLRVIEWMQ